MIRVLFAVLLILPLLGSMIVTAQAAQPELTDRTLISNVTDSSFTVSWFSKDPTITEVVYGENTPNKVVYDDRDGENRQFRYSHYVTLKDLKERTVYKVKVNKETPEEIRQTTAYKIPNPPETKLSLLGSVVSLSGYFQSDGVTYIWIGDSQVLSALIDNTGKWKLEPTALRSRDFGRWLNPQPWNVVDIFSQTGLDGVAYTKTLVANSPRHINVYLSLAKIPFYRMQLGPIDSYATSSAQPSLETLNNPSATASAKPSSFFDIIWVTLFDLFR